MREPFHERLTPAGTLDRSPTREGPWRGWLIAVACGMLVSLTVRLALLPAQGWRPDLDLATSWVHGIATAPLGEAYRTSLNFGPVMAYIYWLLAVVQPAFAVATDASDTGVRIALKLPAVVADIGLVAGVGWLLRDRPRWAILAALGVALSPAIFYVSAWWGQSESVYVLTGLLAAILALAGRPYLAAVALATALMTKPQALVFLPPFVAWAWTRLGVRGATAAGAVLLFSAAVLWTPFLADGGPARLVTTVARIQGEQYPLLSARAWNPWWILQSGAGGGGFLSDQGALLGPLSPRLIGYLAFAILELLIVRAVARDPSRRGLLLGLAASVLVGFLSLTSMHERYAYGALVFLAPLIPDRRILATWLTLNVVVTLNLVAAAPPTQAIGAVVPVDGSLGIVGASAVTVGAVVILWLLIRSRPAPAVSL